MLSALQPSTSALGIANIGLILEIAALIRPARVDGGLRERKLPVLVISAMLVPLSLLNGVVDLWEGTLLLSGALGYTLWMVRVARGASERAEAWSPSSDRATKGAAARTTRSCLDNLTAWVSLQGLVLNPASPLPLYQQLAELLSASIEGGELSVGARLPSEPELSRAHGIGRPTVRQATELLVQRGLIERRRGSGTYVRKVEQRVDLFSLAGTLSSFQKGGIELETKLVRRISKRLVGTDAENPFSEREAFHFLRLSSIKGRPVLCEELFLDPLVFPELPRVPLAGASLAQVVQQRYYLKPTHAEQTFRVARPPEAVRKLLELEPGEPALLVKRTLFFPRAPRAIFSELYCRTEELIFTQTLYAEPQHG